MSKEKGLVKKEEKTGIALYETDQSLLDDLGSAEANDFEFARLTLVQPTSKIQGNAGEVIDSTTNEPVIKANEKLKIIPIWFFKSFSVTNPTTKKWLRNETKVPANAHRGLYENRLDEDGNEWTERVNLYVILEKDLNDPIPTVYRMLIKRSSFKEVRKFLMDWEIQKKTKQYPFSFIWAIKPKLETNDKGKYFVLEFTKEMEAGARKRVTPDQLMAVEYWVRTLVTNKDAIMRVESKSEDAVETTGQPSDVAF